MESNKPLIKDEEAEDVDVHLYRLMIGSLMYLIASKPDITFAVCAYARFQVNPKISHLYAVKRIFRYLKGQPKLGLCYPKHSPLDLEAYSDSDYAGASLDMKSTTGGCQFLGKRLILCQCKKQTIVANSITEAEYVATIVANSKTEAEYVAAANCCGQRLMIAKDGRCFVDTSEVTTGKFMPLTPDLSYTGLDEFANKTVAENTKSSKESKVDCNYHQIQFKNQRMIKHVWNNAQRVNHNFFANKTHHCAKKNIVPRAVLMKPGLVSVNTARQVNVAQLKTTVNAARPMSYLSKTAHSTVKRPIHKNTTFKYSNVNQRVNNVKGNNVNTARPKAVVNAVKRNLINAVKAPACWVWKSNTKFIDHVSKHNTASNTLKKFDYIDAQSGSKSAMAWTMKKLIEDMLLLEETPKDGKSQEKGTKDETSGILKSFITRIENLVDHKVKVIRCDDGTEFKNRELNQFCEMKDHLGKFNGKADEGFFVGYSLNSKDFRVFNSRTRIVEENLHVRFCESSPNVVGSRPDWLFDIDAQTRTMNYEPIVAGTQSNGFAGIRACDNAGQARKETEPIKDYILLPLWNADLLFSQDPKSSHDDGFKPSSDDGKNVNEVPCKGNECNDHEKEDNVNNTNNVNIVSLTVNAAGINKDNELPFDPNMPALEDVGTFYFSNEDEDDDIVADMNNMDTTIQVSHVLTTKIHKDRPLDQVIGDLHSTTQTRQMSKNLEEHGWMSRVLFSMGRLKKRCMYVNHQDLKINTFLIEYTMFKKHYMDYIKLLEHEVKNAGTSIETQKPLLNDEDGEEVDVHIYRSMIGSLMYLTSSRPDIMFAVCACARYQVNPKVSHLHAVKRFFRYLKGHPKLCLWYPKDSSFDLVAYTDSDYARASLDMKSTIRGSSIPTDPQHTLTILQSSSSQPKKTQKPKKPKRKNTQVPQPSGSTEHVTDEAIYKELDDILVRDATTASSLEAKQDSGNIDKTQSKATPNEASSSGTNSSGGPRCQEAMEDTIAQTRFENVSKLSNDLLLVRARVDSSEDDQSLGEDASKQGRKINEIDTDEDIILVNDQDDAKMFDVNDLHGEKVFVEKEVADKKVSDEVQKVVEDINTAKLIVNAAHVSDAGKVNVASIATSVSPAATITTDEITLAQALIEIKTSKPKAKDIVLQEPTKIDVDYQLAQRLIKEEQTTNTKEKSCVLYLKNVEGKKLKDLKNKSFDSIQKMFDRAFNRVNTFVDFRTELVEELKKLMIIIPDEEEVAIDAITSVVKSSKIVDWKIHKEGKKSYYQIIRADGNSKMYMVFNRMLKEFNREDLEDLYNLFKGVLLRLKVILMLLELLKLILELILLDEVSAAGVKDNVDVMKAPVPTDKDKADVVKDKLTNVVKDKADVVKTVVSKDKDQADVVKAPIAKDKEKVDVVKAPVAKDNDKDKAPADVFVNDKAPDDVVNEIQVCHNDIATRG
nr:uncharacterized mitochondrial protein AtMg00810-like [Tanacetum cinerariifolium]